MLQQKKHSRECFFVAQPGLEKSACRLIDRAKLRRTWVRVGMRTKKRPIRSLLCCSTRTRTQTDRTRICSATITPLSSLQGVRFSKADAKVLLFSDMCKYFCKKMQNYCFFSFSLHWLIYIVFASRTQLYCHCGARKSVSAFSNHSKASALLPNGFGA